MRWYVLFTLLTVSILSSSSFAWSTSFRTNLGGMPAIGRADTLEVFVAEALNRGDLAVADQIIETQSKLDSNAIQWHFSRGIRSVMEISYQQDGQNEENIHRVQIAMEKAIEIGERRLEINPSDSMALFYIGGACGYLGIAQVQGGGGFFKGGSTAKRGFRYHEQLIALCPDFYAAYLGPGMKNLMVSALPWVFKPLLYLLGLSGSEERAEEYLTIAYEKGEGVRFEAGNYLAQLYERRKDWVRSGAIYADLLKRYPYRVGMCAQGLGPLSAEKKYDEVVDRCKGMMRRFENDRREFTRADSISMISIISSAGYSFLRQGKTAEAIGFYENALRNVAYEKLNRWILQWSLGDLYRDQRQIREARESYQRALATAPGKQRNKIQKELDNLPSMQ